MLYCRGSTPHRPYQSIEEHAIRDMHMYGYRLIIYCITNLPLLLFLLFLLFLLLHLLLSLLSFLSSCLLLYLLLYLLLLHTWLYDAISITSPISPTLGSIPSEISNLVKLGFLHLYENRLTGMCKVSFIIIIIIIMNIMNIIMNIIVISIIFMICFIVEGLRHIDRTKA